MSETKAITVRGFGVVWTTDEDEMTVSTYTEDVEDERD